MAALREMTKSAGVSMALVTVVTLATVKPSPATQAAQTSVELIVPCVTVALAMDIKDLKGSSYKEHDNNMAKTESNMTYATNTTSNILSSVHFDNKADSLTQPGAINKHVNTGDSSGNNLNTHMSHEAAFRCPGVDYLLQHPNTTLLDVGNMTDCENTHLDFPSSQGVVYGRCRNSQTFCYLQVEVAEDKVISAEFTLMPNSLCRPDYWAVYMYERRPQCLLPCVSPAAFHITCMTRNWSGLNHTVQWSTNRAYILFHNNPQVYLKVKKNEGHRLKVYSISLAFGYVHVHSAELGVYLSQVDEWTDIHVPVGQVIEIKFRNFVVIECQVYCRVFSDRHETDPDVTVSMCRDINDATPAVFNTSLLKLHFHRPQSYAATFFSLYVFYMFYDLHSPKSNIPAFDCTKHGMYYKEDCLWDGFCEDGLEEQQHCPSFSTGCRTWIPAIGKCLEVVSGTMPLMFRQVDGRCKARGGTLLTFKSESDHVKGTEVIRAKVNVHEYNYLYIATGLTGGWYMVPFMYRMFFRWSDKTVIYNAFLGLANDNMPRTVRQTGIMLNGTVIVMRSVHRRPTETFICEYESKVQKRYGLRNVSFPTLTPVIDRKHGDLEVCPGGHLSRTFLVCDVQSHCGHMKPASVCVLCHSCQHQGAVSSVENPVLSVVVMFTCDDDFSTIQYTLVCDFRQDCSDQSDESFCVHPPCQEWQCANGQCVSFDEHCDGYSDCLDDSDEATALCGHTLKKPLQRLHQLHLIDLDGKGYFTHHRMKANESCPETHYLCTSDPLCLPVYTRCNGYNDCINKEDETDCESATCAGFYQCRASTVCVHVDQVCDGWGQCPQRDDEWLCNTTCPVGCLCQGLSFVCPQPFSAHLYPQLRYLDARGSGLTLSDFKHNVYLVRLTLSYCSLVSLLAQSFLNMRFLDVSHNNITTLTVDHLLSLPSLRVVVLADNPLTTLVKGAAQQSHTALKKIDLSTTSLTLFDSNSLVSFPKLESLNLSSSDIQIVGPSGFHGTPQLKELDLRGNTVHHFSADIFQGLDQLAIIYSSNFRLCCQKIMSTMLNRPSCQAPPPVLSSCENLLPSNTYTFLFGTFSIVSVCGVLLSFISQCIMKNPFRRNVFLCLCNLQFSCLCMGIYTSIVTVADSVFSEDYVLYESAWTKSMACQMAGFVSRLSAQLSLLIIWIMTLDHVTGLCWSFRAFRFSTRSTCLALGVTWMSALALASLALVHGQPAASINGVSGLCQLGFIDKQYLQTAASSVYLLAAFNVLVCLMIVVGQLFICRATPKYRITADAEKKAVLPSQPLVTAVSVTTSVCWLSITVVSVMIMAGVADPEALWVTLVVMAIPLSSSLYPLFYCWSLIDENRRHEKEHRVLQRLKARRSLLHKH